LGGRPAHQVLNRRPRCRGTARVACRPLDARLESRTPRCVEEPYTRGADEARDFVAFTCDESEAFARHVLARHPAPEIARSAKQRSPAVKSVDRVKSGAFDEDLVEDQIAAALEEELIKPSGGALATRLAPRYAPCDCKRYRDDLATRGRALISWANSAPTTSVSDLRPRWHDQRIGVRAVLGASEAAGDRIAARNDLEP